MTDQTGTMLATVGVWAAVALLVLWGCRRPDTPMFSGDRWRLQQIPLWTWMAGGVCAGAELWQGTWLLYGVLGPIMAGTVLAVWAGDRRAQARAGRPAVRS